MLIGTASHVLKVAAAISSALDDINDFDNKSIITYRKTGLRWSKHWHRKRVWFYHQTKDVVPRTLPRQYIPTIH